MYPLMTLVLTLLLLSFTLLPEVSANPVDSAVAWPAARDNSKDDAHNDPPPHHNPPPPPHHNPPPPPPPPPKPSTCTIKPLGHGKDDTAQVLEAISKCGKGGHTILEAGNYNITRKMTWELENSKVDIYGYLNFILDIDYWLNFNNTYQVVFIQSQSSWFVVTGNDFEIDAHNQGGIQGNGQKWWEHGTEVVRNDGDGRPISLTLFKANRAKVSNFRIESPPFWCNCIANSTYVEYDGMYCNATNSNSTFFGQNILPNTDGMDFYRSDHITLKNSDITSGDDCLAVKGNTTNLMVSNLTCHGGNGIAFGSLGEYVQLNDDIENVVFDTVHFDRLNATIQPSMVYAIYFKSWTDTVVGVPPKKGMGGGGGGFVRNVVAKNFFLDQVDTPVLLFQTYRAPSNNTPSRLQFSDLTFEDFSGTTTGATLVDLECSPRVPCPGIKFSDFHVTPPKNVTATYYCNNTISVIGLPHCDNSTKPLE